MLERKSVKKNVRVGTLARKHATFDVWSLGEKADEEDDNDGADVGGEEIKSLSCLLPRKSKNGNLYPGKTVSSKKKEKTPRSFHDLIYFDLLKLTTLLLAPRPIARHLVVSAQAAAPTPSVPIHPYTQPPRESYPKEVLTHSFKPYGSLSDARTQDEGGMDVDVRSAPTSSATHAKARRAKVGSPEMDKKKKKGKETETRADAMDVDVSPSRAAPSLPPTVKKAKPANAQATEVKEKTKGKKRKGDSVEEKKSKKVKT